MKIQIFFYRVLVVALTALGLALATHAWSLRQELARRTAAPATAAVAAVNNADPALWRQLLRDREAAYFKLKDDYDRPQREMTEQSAPLAPPASPVSPTTNRVNRGESWLERLRAEDPARYQQIQAEREQRRQQRAAELERQLDRLGARWQAATT